MNPLSPVANETQEPTPERVGFHCHICQEPSEKICPRCTRDACDNHLCERCRRCSDCCDCDA